MIWLRNSIIECGSFNTRYFWVIENFDVGALILTFDVEYLAIAGLLEMHTRTIRWNW